MRTGVLEAEGELIVFTDADGSYGPGGGQGDGRARRRSGGHRVAAGRLGHRPTGRRLASRLFNRAIRVLLGLPFGDTQCGLKGFRRQAAPGVFGRAWTGSP